MRTGDAESRSGPRRPWPGLLVAGVTACSSGVAVFVNSYAVHALPDASVYTTAKNALSALFLGALSAAAIGLQGRWAVARRWTTAPSGPAPPGGAGEPRRWWGLAYVGVVGGGVAFVLFFEGLARTEATPAAFLHSSLVVWVAVLALPFLGERPSLWNGAAIALLVIGQTVLDGGVGHLVASSGQLMVLGATLLWAVETVVAKRLLFATAPVTVALARMGIGTMVLVGYLGVTGRLDDLVHLDAAQAGWVVLTGALLALYVATWTTALARSRALDVTSVLVGAAVLTALLQAAGGTAALDVRDLALVAIALGVAAVAWAARQQAVRGEAR